MSFNQQIPLSEINLLKVEILMSFNFIEVWMEIKSTESRNFNEF